MSKRFLTQNEALQKIGSTGGTNRFVTKEWLTGNGNFDTSYLTEYQSGQFIVDDDIMSKPINRNVTINLKPTFNLGDLNYDILSTQVGSYFIAYLIKISYGQNKTIFLWGPDETQIGARRGLSAFAAAQNAGDPETKYNQPNIPDYPKVVTNGQLTSNSPTITIKSNNIINNISFVFAMTYNPFYDSTSERGQELNWWIQYSFYAAGNVFKKVTSQTSEFNTIQMPEDVIGGWFGYKQPIAKFNSETGYLIEGDSETSQCNPGELISINQNRMEDFECNFPVIIKLAKADRTPN